MARVVKLRAFTSLFVLTTLAHAAGPEPFSTPQKPVLHGRHWVAITEKPPGATAGARMFQRGGIEIDTACAMLAVVCTMYDTLSWGGETQR